MVQKFEDAGCRYTSKMGPSSKGPIRLVIFVSLTVLMEVSAGVDAKYFAVGQHNSTRELLWQSNADVRILLWRSIYSRLGGYRRHRRWYVHLFFIDMTLSLSNPSCVSAACAHPSSLEERHFSQLKRTHPLVPPSHIDFIPCFRASPSVMRR